MHCTVDLTADCTPQYQVWKIIMIIMVSECLFEILSLGYGLLNYLIINYWYLKLNLLSR